METKYIGDKKIKNHTTLIEKTPAGIEMIEVEYMTGTKEVLSKTMFDNLLSDKSCDATKLREKRIHPVVGTVLAVLREWGLKAGEFAFFTALLNQSMDNNKNQAEKYLWQKYSPTINSLDDIDMITIDRVLKDIPNEDQPSPYVKE